MSVTKFQDDSCEQNTLGILSLNSNPILNIYTFILIGKIRLSKTFHKFRVLAKKLRKAIDANDSIKKTPFENLSQPTKDILKLSASLTDVIDSEGTSYLGKVNFICYYGFTEIKSFFLSCITFIFFCFSLRSTMAM